MVDTLKIRLDNVSFQSGCDLELKEHSTSLRTGEKPQGHFLFKAGDVVVRGTGAYKNENDFYLDVSPRRQSPEIVDTNVHFSVAAKATGNNYFLTDKDGMAQVFGELQEWLKEKGVVANVGDAFLSRVDLTKNHEFDHPFHDYRGVYAAMTTQRLEPHEYGDGYLWENGAQQITSYSKILEMALKAKKENRQFDASLYPENVQRVEWRLFGRKKIETSLKTDRASGLLDVYDTLSVARKEALKKQLFRYSPAEKRRVLTLADARQTFRRLQDSGEKFWFEKFWAMLPLSFLSEGDLDAILAAAVAESPNRNTPSRIRKKMATFKMDSLVCRKVGELTAADLYREMEEKILSD